MLGSVVKFFNRPFELFQCWPVIIEHIHKNYVISSIATGDKLIRLPLRGLPILLSLAWLQIEFDDTKFYYHYLSNIL